MASVISSYSVHRHHMRSDDIGGSLTVFQSISFLACSDMDNSIIEIIIIDLIIMLLLVVEIGYVWVCHLLGSLATTNNNIVMAIWNMADSTSPCLNR